MGMTDRQFDSYQARLLDLLRKALESVFNNELCGLSSLIFRKSRRRDSPFAHRQTRMSRRRVAENQPKRRAMAY